VSRLSRQCGILNISQPYRPPRPVTGITKKKNGLITGSATYEQSRLVGGVLRACYTLSTTSLKACHILFMQILSMVILIHTVH
jgi:hypothetical protein